MTNSAVILILFGAVIGVATGLRCWKCIADDCDTNPEGNYKAKEVSCGEEAECMKVRYRMYDNVTFYDSIIRTCSTGPCTQSKEEEFEECLAKRAYMVSGCALRSCCSDKDMCNGEETVLQTRALWNIVGALFSIVYMFNMDMAL